MTLVDQLSRRKAVLIGLTVASAAACSQLGNTQSEQALAPAQALVLAEAKSDYDVGPERSPVSHTDHAFPVPAIPEADAPHMTIATMQLKSGHGKPPHRLIARITSDGDYPAMGIYRGVNFVWRSSWDDSAASTWVTRIVPTKPFAPDYVLTRDPRLREYTSGDPREPRLVRVTVASIAFAACLDDPMCGTGHCGYR